MAALMREKSGNILALLLVVVCMLLTACDSQQQKADGAQPGKQEMQRLQLLIVQAVALASLPGETVSRQAADLLRRAMSGPEMNAMHHGDGNDAALPGSMMQQTHNLGDAAFDLLEAGPLNTADHAWRNRLAMTALAAAMRLEGMLLGAASGEFEAAQGRLLAERMVSESGGMSLSADSSYGKAASRLISALQLL